MKRLKIKYFHHKVCRLCRTLTIDPYKAEVCRKHVMLGEVWPLRCSVEVKTLQVTLSDSFSHTHLKTPCMTLSHLNSSTEADNKLWE